MTRFRLRIAAAARTDFDSIAGYIRRDDPERAASFVDELARKIEAVAERPMSFPARPDLRSDLRSAHLRDYLIVFRVSDIRALFRRPT